MSIPREGSRDVAEGIIISLSPDVCKTPVGSTVPPIPYSVFAKQGDDANTAASVSMTGKRAHNMASIITKTQGDDPGGAGGIKSGTVGAACHPKGHSSSVKIQGKPAVRSNDEWYMNNKNTIGKLSYIESIETFEPTPAILLSQSPESELDLGTWEEIDETNVSDAVAAIMGGMARARAEGVPEGSFQVAQAAPQVMTDAAAAQPRPAPGTPPPANNPRPPNRIPRPPAKIIQFPRTPPPTPPAPNIGGAAARGLMGRIALGLSLTVGLILYPTAAGTGSEMPSFAHDINYDDPVEMGIYSEGVTLLNQDIGNPAWREEVHEWVTTEIATYRVALALAQEGENTGSESEVTPENVRVTSDRDRRRRDPCNVQRYGSIQCPGGQAHHIVPDSVLRYGNRTEGEAGINRIPGMPSFRDGMAICLSGNAGDVGGEHNIAQRTTDPLIAAAGRTAPIPKTTTVSVATSAGIAGAIAAKPECAKEIAAGVAAQFGSIDGNRLVNAANRPATGVALDALKAGQ